MALDLQSIYSELNGEKVITNSVEVHANFVEGPAALWAAFQISGPRFLKGDHFF